MTNDAAVPNVTPDVLNPTELRVVKLLTMGCSINEIANRIDSNARTVESQRDGIYEKLGIHDQTTLTRWARLFDVPRW
jgi:DNA-binding NarL/FixJ family response regulator